MELCKFLPPWIPKSRSNPVVEFGEKAHWKFIPPSRRSCESPSPILEQWLKINASRNIRKIKANFIQSSIAFLWVQSPNSFLGVWFFLIFQPSTRHLQQQISQMKREASSSSRLNPINRSRLHASSPTPGAPLGPLAAPYPVEREVASPRAGISTSTSFNTSLHEHQQELQHQQSALTRTGPQDFKWANHRLLPTFKLEPLRCLKLEMFFGLFEYFRGIMILCISYFYRTAVDCFSRFNDVWLNFFWHNRGKQLFTFFAGYQRNQIFWRKSMKIPICYLHLEVPIKTWKVGNGDA